MQKQKIEVHLTADLKNEESFFKFKKVCLELDAKPLEIILARGDHPRQIMLSREMEENQLIRVHQAVQPWIDLFEKNQIAIIRKKYEIPFFKDVSNDFKIDYYEWHGQIEYKHVLELKIFCEIHRVHLSYNSLKNFEKYRFLTLREYGGASIFLARLVQLKAELYNQNRKLIKERAECCIYDSNIALDQGWLSI